MRIKSKLHGGARLTATAVALLLVQCASNGPESAHDYRLPNVVLIVTDNQGWGQLGSHGNEIIQTPNLDRLAAESAEFTRFYASPVCAPTRASLLTGRYNYRTGVVDTYMGRAMMYTDEVTLAEILAEAGYRTGIFGKWHLGDNYPMRPMEQGFQEVLVHRGGGIGQPADPPGNSYFDPILQHNGQPKQYKGYCTDIFFRSAMQFVDDNRDQPFFLYVPTNAPHPPYLVPDGYAEPYLAAGLSDSAARNYGMITNIDENIGKLLGKLEQHALTQNTILIFMSDNGPTVQHYTAGLRSPSWSVYEGGIRVPFFFRWPAKVKPAKVDRIAAHIDVAPTLLDALNIAKPANTLIDGLSLMPLLRADDRDWPARTIYLQAHRGNEPQLYRAFAAVSQRFKLVQPMSFRDPKPDDARLQLFDIEADPGETRDVADQHPQVFEKLRKGYEVWFHDVSSTRGYTPPKIALGTSHENPVILTRQDWRIVGRDGWGDTSLGYWEVDVRTAGTYEIRFRFAPHKTSGRAEFKLGPVERTQQFKKGAESVTFGSLALPSGNARLEARLISGDEMVGVRYVDVLRSDD